jgi:hypothetical protein
MATYIRQLTDNAGNNILPATRAEGVYFHDNTTLDSIMSSQAGVVAKALGDKNGKDITGYVTNLTSKGTVVTFTKGDGSKGTFNTQDTTYEEATGSKAGLMSAEDKAKLDGIAPNANNYTHPSHTAAAAGLYKVTVDALGHVTATTPVAKSDITGLGIPAQDTTYNAFKGASASAAGGTGLVPAPAKGDQAKFLKADGTWGTPENTTYEEATTSTAGLMSSADKTKLNGIEAGANKYTHPSYTSKASGLYKITVDATGHVSAAAAVEKSDITALGIPGQDTTYQKATQSTDGLMSAADKTKLDNIPTSVLGYASNWGADADDLPARPIA